MAASFMLEREAVMQRLREFSEADWHGGLEWLDVSGVALYFLDRLRTLGAEAALPRVIEEALDDRLRRNRERIDGLRREAAKISDWLQDAGVNFALLKGFTLVPHSVPDPNLRSQADLDFLVEQRCREVTVEYAGRLGYSLHGESRGSLEFRAPGEDAPGLDRGYSARSQRALELHFAADSRAERSLLARRVPRAIDDLQTFALAEPDILVHQARHLLKHFCGEYTRLSWVLEFHRHVMARRGDVEFWRDAEQVARTQENGDLAMATALWIARDLFGDVPVVLPEQWQTRALPKGVRLWLTRYAHQVLLGPPRPSKLYVLLRRELPGAAESRRSLRAILFPHYLPARVLDPRPYESWPERWRRFGFELRFFVSRLCFHILEGIRFGIEAFRWRRAVARAGQ
ncbi:MAG TPA: nucleotidyltransferase family protein [Terracidiphilus sp.]